MENHEWIIPVRFESRDAAAGLRSIEEGVLTAGNLGQTADTTSGRFRQAHESIASASRQYSRLRAAIREGGPAAEDAFSGSIIKGLSEQRLGSAAVTHSLETQTQGPQPASSGEADGRVGQETASRSDPGGDGHLTGPDSMDGLAVLSEIQNLDRRGWAGARPGDRPRTPSADVSPDQDDGGSFVPGTRPEPPSDRIDRAGRLSSISRQSASLLGGRRALDQALGRPGQAIEADEAGLGKIGGDRAVPMGQRGLADYRAWTADNLGRDATPTSRPDWALVPTGEEAPRSAGGITFPVAPIAGIAPPGIAPNAMTRSPMIPSALTPTADDQWTSHPRATNLGPIGGRGSEGGLGASNGAIERLLREQNDLIRQELQRDTSRPIAAPPPLRGAGIRM